jgi:hypothetical protein
MVVTEPLSLLTDAELQARIDRFAAQMLEADARFQRTGSIDDRAQRDRLWIAERSVLRERSRRRCSARALEEEREIERLKEEDAALRRRLEEGSRGGPS